MRSTDLADDNIEIAAERLIGKALYTGPTVSRDQLVGVEACLNQLEGQIALSAQPDLAKRFRLDPSGTLFVGPPGTGKTLLARYLAGRLDIPLYQISADQFRGDTALLHAVFERLGPERALLFIDEVSILAQRRDYSGQEEREMLAALLTELDGLSSSPGGKGLWVIGACTPDIHLDPAIYRAGRLGVVIEFARPSELQRRELLNLYLRGVPHKVRRSDINRLARISDHATGADANDWIKQAASLALGERSSSEPVIRYRHLETVVARRLEPRALSDRPLRAVPGLVAHQPSRQPNLARLRGDPSGRHLR
jgi:SpoVK/Ycf46/Vps4 family AAA+-type ATPase